MQKHIFCRFPEYNLNDWKHGGSNKAKWCEKCRKKRFV